MSSASEALDPDPEWLEPEVPADPPVPADAAGAADPAIPKKRIELEVQVPNDEAGDFCAERPDLHYLSSLMASSNLKEDRLHYTLAF